MSETRENAERKTKAYREAEARKEFFAACNQQWRYTDEEHLQAEKERWQNWLDLQDAAGGGAAAAQVGESSNTPTSNSHTPINAGLFRGGIDTFHASLWCESDPREHKELFALLHKAQQEAQEGEAGLIPHPEGGFISVRPSGVKHGFEFYPYVLEFAGVQIHLSKHNNYKNPLTPNVVVRIGSAALTQHNGLYWWNEAKRLLNYMGFKVIKNTLSRVDINVDCPGIPMETFGCKLLGMAGCVTRARKATIYMNGNKLETFGIGAGDIKVRFYDKLAETKEKPGKRNQVVAERCQGKMPESLTRIEYQLRRQALIERGIDTVEDFELKAASLCEYLTGEWLRLVEHKDKQNNHQSRSILMPLWEIIQRSFQAAVNWSPDPKPIEKRVHCVPSVVSLVKQAFGCMGTALAVLGISVSTPEEIKKALTQYIFPIVEEHDVKKAENKKHKIASLQPTMEYQEYHCGEDYYAELC